MTAFCPDYVIFDMDGLLVNSEPVWAMVEDEVVSRRGFALHADIRNQFIGMRMRDFWDGVKRAYEFAEPVEVFIDEVTSNMVVTIPIHATAQPGANELLAYLAERRVPLALASSSPMAIIEAVVGHFGWRGYFQHLVTGDEVPNGKPAPDIFLEAARRLGADPARCLVLEDSRNGARGAVAAGMTCYAVPDVSHGGSNFEGITPHVFADLHAVREALRAACAAGA